MVNVPVKDQHFFALVYRILGCHGNVVEKAIARNKVLMGVVSWGSHNTISSLERTRALFVREHRLHSLKAVFTCEFSSSECMLVREVFIVKLVRGLSFFEFFTCLQHQVKLLLGMHLEKDLVPVSW